MRTRRPNNKNRTMKILTIIRKNGKTTIEMPDDADVLEVLKENEIKHYISMSEEIVKDKTIKPIP